MQHIKKIFTVVLLTAFFVSCTKYAANTKSTTSGSSGSNPTGATPIDTATGQSNGKDTATKNDSADAVYVQGYYAVDPTQTFGAKNNATGSIVSILNNSKYTQLEQSNYTFYKPPTNGTQLGVAAGSVNFPNKGYYTLLINYNSPSVVVLDNGQTPSPSTSKAYVRFVNITPFKYDDTLNFKITKGSDVYYFSYRRPYDIYANNTNDSTTWISIYNQQYNTTYSNFTEVNPGFYNGEIYLNDKLWKSPTYNFIGGKKYTVFVRQGVNTNPASTDIIYYFNYIVHN